MIVLSSLIGYVIPVKADGLCDTVSEIPTIECESLLTLYNSTDGPNWVLNFWGADDEEWLSTNTPCRWYGVDCEGGHVTSLWFWQSHLNGNLPSEIGNFTNLQSIYMDLNQLSGTIPPELGQLTNLQFLTLSNNELTGNIPPELGDLNNLVYLNLGGNNLDGTVPPALGTNGNLSGLYLWGNQLDGNIPPELGQLTQLTNLDLYKNQLDGNIPPELGQLTQLTNLGLYENQLSGNIPPELGNLTVLETLFLDNNQLSGSVPLALSDLINLRFLKLDMNQLSGNLPTELGNLNNLEYFSLSENPLSGPLPNNLKNLPLYLFYFQNTGLCEPSDLAFQTWLNYIDYVKSTDILCTIPVVIPPEGGVLTSNDGRVTVQFPAGAVTISTTVTYTHQIRQPTGNLADVNRFFQLEASQNGNPITQFDKPITITVEYLANHTLIKNTIHLYWFSQTTWISDSISIVSQTDTSLSSATDHFTLFGVLGKTNLIHLPVIMKQ